MKFNIKKSIQILERTPKVLNTYLKDLNDDWVFNNEGKNTWNPFDIVGHLVHGEKTDWITRTKILLKNNPKLTFDSFDRFAQIETSKVHLDFAWWFIFSNDRINNASSTASTYSHGIES